LFQKGNANLIRPATSAGGVRGLVLRFGAMIATTKLYHADSLRSTFHARVVGHGRFGGAASVILDQTAFYPESGGQMADRGVLGGVDVTDVQIGDDGVIHHMLAGAAPDVGADVDGAIDRARRRVHMALHTGQHMLSRALVDVARADTVSSRLGETACTIDVDQAQVADRDLARAEDLVNSIIDDDLTVRAFFPEPAELAALPLRRAPKVETDVRVVAVGDFDVSPCGGTHCLRTAQVGGVAVTGVERYKGKIRVTFAAGRRARVELAEKAAILSALGRDLTCGPAEVPAALAKLRRELVETREALGQARAQLMDRLADDLIAAARARGDTTVRALVPDADGNALRILAKRITAEPGFVALVAATTAAGTQVLAARGAGSGFDCAAFIKGLPGARGGGSAERAEGRLPPGAVDWDALAAAPTRS
jgi:alanyl-tRNA synthetase